MNGFIIPRDASQQILAGKDVAGGGDTDRAGGAGAGHGGSRGGRQKTVSTERTGIGPMMFENPHTAKEKMMSRLRRGWGWVR